MTVSTVPGRAILDGFLEQWEEGETKTFTKKQFAEWVTFTSATVQAETADRIREKCVTTCGGEENVQAYLWRILDGERWPA